MLDIEGVSEADISNEIKNIGFYSETEISEYLSVRSN